MPIAQDVQIEITIPQKVEVEQKAEVVEVSSNIPQAEFTKRYETYQGRTILVLEVE